MKSGGTPVVLERIEDQISATGLPLLASSGGVRTRTPVILTLHWHAFIREKLLRPGRRAGIVHTRAQFCMQLNERWRDLVAIDRAAMEAAWELGAWDVARRAGARLAGASSGEALNACGRSARFRLV
jgi:hypothetical protein